MPRARRGLTLIEALVVFSVLAILLGLAMPALASAKEFARALRCRANLSQLAAATAQYESTFSMLPAIYYREHPVAGDFYVPPYAVTTPSIQAQLLPYLEQGDLFAGINAKLPLLPPGMDDERHLATVARTRVAVFLCPSDPNAAQLPSGINYRASVSVGPMPKQSPEFPDGGNGFFGGIAHCPKLVMVSDGLSKTAMFSERSVGDGNPRSVDAATAMLDAGLANTADATLALCAREAASGTAESAGVPGGYWLASGCLSANYTHVLPPNSIVTDCIATNLIPSAGAATARSWHGDTVNVAFGDGSVRAVADSVALDVWRAIGSRNGHEATSE